MNTKKYEVFKTKKKMVAANKLTASPRDDIFFDFSALDDFKDIDDTTLDRIKNELMYHHTAGASWISQPIPFSVVDGKFTSFQCGFNTAYTKVYTKSYKRMMIIITVTSAHVEKWERESTYDRNYSLSNIYDVKSDFSSGEYPDIEVA